MKIHIETLDFILNKVALKVLASLLYVLLLLSSMNCRHVFQQEPTVEESACADLDSGVFPTYEKAPHVLKAVQPIYPEAARQAGMEGTVFLRVLIDKEGKVARAEVQRSDAEIFNQPALDAIKQWLFTPAWSGGSSVCVWVAVPIKFKL